ncbi:MAG: trkA2 [Clostridiales bacterium]|jgi:trk system potassium uptake protein TrkA|nr:trkA2 [Clostridiales bacterium]
MYIIIIGCGRLGSTLAKGLADDGNDICIIDRNGDKLNTLGSGFNGRRIKGIEFDSDNLLEAGVNQADALFAVTPDDNINITVSLIADKIFQVPKIIARVNDPGKKFIYSKLGINTINPVQSEIEILKNKLYIKNLGIVLSLDNNYEIIDLLVSKEKSIAVKEIEEKYCCIISGLIKDGKVRLPEKNEIIHTGDRMICTIRKTDKGRLINSYSKEKLL